MRQVALVVLVGAGILAGFAATSWGSATDQGAVQRCKLKGLRYSGTTSQRQKLCFTLWSSGARLAEYAYGFRDSCGAGTLRTTAKNGIAVSGGRFSSSGSSGSFFKGRIAGSTASGTLRVKQTNYGVVPAQTCDSGVARWTAHRVR